MHRVTKWISRKHIHFLALLFSPRQRYPKIKLFFPFFLHRPLRSEPSPDSPRWPRPRLSLRWPSGPPSRRSPPTQLVSSYIPTPPLCTALRRVRHSAIAALPPPPAAGGALTTALFATSSPALSAETQIDRKPRRRADPGPANPPLVFGLSGGSN